MQTTLDIAALVAAIAWPVFLLVVAVIYRDRIPLILSSILPRVKSLSIAGFSIELATAAPIPLVANGMIDLAHAGRPDDVNDSTLRSFYEQFGDPTQIDYAVVDLGNGRQWLTSRLLILSFLLSRMRGLKCLAFVETVNDLPRRFVGMADCDVIRWRLARTFPWLESARANAEGEVWPRPILPPSFQNWERLITNDDGRIVDLAFQPQPAADLLKAYLRLIQAPTTVPIPEEWQLLPNSNTPTIEHASWLTASKLDDMTFQALDRQSLRLQDLERGSESEKAALIIQHPRQWVPVISDDGTLFRVIDRQKVIEAILPRLIGPAISDESRAK